MAICSVCKNDYAKSFTISLNGRVADFDCFECAIHALAPRCKHCQCKIIGHGMENQDSFYCCAHCAKQDGVTGLADHI